MDTLLQTVVEQSAWSSTITALPPDDLSLLTAPQSTRIIVQHIAYRRIPIAESNIAKRINVHAGERAKTRPRLDGFRMLIVDGKLTEL